MEVLIVPNADVACLRAARIVGRLLRAKPDAALAPPDREHAGRHLRRAGPPAPRRGALLRARHGLQPGRVRRDPPDHPGSFRRAIDEALYRQVDLPPARAHAPDGQAADLAAACTSYEAAIAAAGGLDLALLGLGTDGHIAFNEPTSSLGSRTRLKTLTDETRAANQHAFGAEPVPHHALTVGIATIMSARRCLLVAFGMAKAAAVAKMVEGPLAALVPASVLQLHPHATVIVDEAAAEGLALRNYYDAVAAAKPAWQRED